MHRFVQRSHVGILSNERTRFTQLDPKLMFRGVSERYVTAELWCNTGRTGAIDAQVRATKSHWNFLQRTLPIHPIGPQTHVRVVLDRFITS
jgi:hypothetical protein